MKTWIICATIGAMCAGAMAQSQVTVDEIRIAGALNRIDLPRDLRNVWPDEFDQVKGSYRLSNGKTMRLEMWGNRMYAKIDGMPRAQLVAVTPYAFVGLNRQMQISISDIDSAGPVNAEILLVGPALSGTPDGRVIRLMASR